MTLQLFHIDMLEEKTIEKSFPFPYDSCVPMAMRFTCRVLFFSMILILLMQLVTVIVFNNALGTDLLIY